MNRDDALKKIKKCLALGRNAESHEAAAAMRQAQKLMAEFNLEEGDVALSEVREAKTKASTQAANVWEVALANMVADAFGCEMYCSRSSNWNSSGSYVRKLFYVFVGLSHTADIAGYAFEVLTRQCAKARMAHIAKQPKNCKPITKTARGDAFAEGWVLAVRDLVERFARPAADQALVLAYMGRNHPDLKDAKTRDTTLARRIDYGHQVAGFRAGKTAQLNQGVGGVQERRLLA